MLNFVAGSLTHVVGGWVGTYLNGFIFLPSKRDIEGAALKFKCFLDLVTYSLIAGALITNMG